MKAQLRFNRDFEIGTIDPRLYSGFAEHLGRHVYSGMYEPTHPTADKNGFRTDVLDLLRELNLTAVRYPGGNFVSGYRWEDGIGPRDQRPRRIEPAWNSIETNEFGLDEFIAWCRELSTEPLIAINLGTRGSDEAKDIYEYCNLEGGTEWSDRRKANGSAKPHNVKMWCLGNEMDGPWQMGHVDATTYGQRARSASNLLKMMFHDMETVACGSSNRGMPTFGKWEYDTLMQCYDTVEYISAHVYYGRENDDSLTFLGKPEDMGRQIEEVASVCDAVKAILKSDKQVHISFDEYNVWYHSHNVKVDPYMVAPPILEDIYDVEDAVVFGGMLIQLINHADRVKIACVAQLVNVIAPVMAAAGGPAWRQTIFYPFRDASQYGRGKAMRLKVDSPFYIDGKGQSVPLLSAAAVSHNNGYTVFAVNRSLTEPLDLTLACGNMESISATSLHHANTRETNTEARQDAVVPVENNQVQLTPTGATVTLPPCSWSVIHLG